MPEHRTDTAATPAPDDTLRERLAERASLLAVSKSEQAKIVDVLLPTVREHVAAAVQAERERSADDRLVMAIFGTPSDGPQPFALVSDDPKPRPFAYGVQWPGGTVTVKAIDGSAMGNVTSPSLEDHFNQYGKSAVVWLAEDLGTLADMEERAMKAEAAIERVRAIADNWFGGPCISGYRIPNDDDNDSECLHCAAYAVRAALDGEAIP